MYDRIKSMKEGGLSYSFWRQLVQIGYQNGTYTEANLVDFEMLWPQMDIKPLRGCIVELKAGIYVPTDDPYA